VCGDLSSAFEVAAKAPEAKLEFPQRDAVLEGIHKAQFKQLPAGYRKLSPADIAAGTWMPRQEKGVRPSRLLPYELHASGKLSADGKSIEIAIETGKAVGSAFHVYTPGPFHKRADLRTRAYAVEAGKRLTDTWELAGFENGVYHLRLCGPNGFLREFSGTAQDPAIEIHCEYAKGDLEVVVTNDDRERGHGIRIADQSYGSRRALGGGKAGGEEERPVAPCEELFVVRLHPHGRGCRALCAAIRRPCRNREGRLQRPGNRWVALN
jgi:phospholipase C